MFVYPLIRREPTLEFSVGKDSGYPVLGDLATVLDSRGHGPAGAIIRLGAD
mgnify:FL=1